MSKSINSCVTGFVICVILFVGGLGYAAYLNYDLLIRMGRSWTETTGKWARAFEQAFQTKVTVEGRSFTLGRSQIKELALLQNQIVVVTKSERSHLGVNAIVIVRGVYKAKFGFDLDGAGPIHVGPLGSLDEGSLPTATLLSIEEVEKDIFYKSDNPINLPNAADVERAYHENQVQARKDAEATGMLEETKRLLRDHLEDLIEVQQLQAGSDQVEQGDSNGEDNRPKLESPQPIP